MADRYIPANPDISGIGVRAAIYAQNLLCFAPVVVHLWDGEVSLEEMSGIMDQSIGMLAIAFAILVSTAIQATAKTSGQSITNFHAAIILDLSWMNNTSTFIWFLLYAHHRSKNKNKDELIPATLRDWIKVLFSPLRRSEKKNDDRKDSNQGGRQSGNSRNEGEDVWPEKPSRTCISHIQHSWHLIEQSFVLTLGSIHLTLMSAIGIWLWSNPKKFGTHIWCDPSLTIVGITWRFSSRAMQICSLTMYSLFLVPGLNLIPPFLLLLTPHILYNKSRRRYPQFWMRCRHILDAMRRIPRGSRNTPQTLPLIADDALRGRGAALDEEAQVGDNQPLIPSGAQLADPPSGDSSSGNPVNLTDSMPAQEQYVRHPPSGSSTSQSPSSDAHTALLVVGLVCLAAINIIFIIDIELTLSRNKQDQSHEEAEWGFGQVLALLLLVVPLRDFLKSMVVIYRKPRKDNKAEPNIQGECWYTSRPTLTQTGNQGISMEQHYRPPRRLETSN